MQDQITEALKNHGADYVEVRLEEGQGTHIRYRGRDLEEIGRTSSLGGNVRAIAGGGWGFVCFNNLDDLKEKVAQAVSHARVVGGEAVRLSPVEPRVDIVRPTIHRDPRTVPLKEKKRVLDEYVDIIWSTSGIQSSVVGYGDGYRKVTFANSEGTYIEQEKIETTLRIAPMARDGTEVQQAGISLGASGDYSWVETLHDEVQILANRAVELLKAPQVKGGEYPVILDPVLAGVFVHEAFGHLSEADHVYESDHLKEIMVLGRRFGGSHLNIVDGGAIPDLRGSYKYDDEGTPSTRTDLIREGVLVGRLHSRETAFKMKEVPSGNARAISFHFPPIVRMTNTIIEPGEATFEEMVADVKEGVYARNWYGGMTSMEMFTFSAREAYMIRNGKVAELLRPVMLSGNLFTSLKNLDAIASDIEMNQGGGCGKGGQSPLPVSNGSPHIRIRNCLVGGT
ncbi:MAG: peptidase C69 [SAR202 cluster bacterium Io17-Chloro-G3]|nr:MAG: peptidase C69 [SAR202 cluster bacterium Io17-Chloro-G3]